MKNKKTSDETSWFFVSLYEKEPYEQWVRWLCEERSYCLVATSGTAEWIRSLGFDCTTVESLFGLSPRMAGKVKSLHPDLHAGVMAEHREEMDEDIPWIGGVGIDLTPFRQDGECRWNKVDIGGPALLRAAAKNWEQVVTVATPRQATFHRKHGEESPEKRKKLARETLKETLRYDKRLLGEFDGTVGNTDLGTRLSLPSSTTLRYGENPDEQGEIRRDLFREGELPFERMHGKEYSYTNVLDMNAARRLAPGGSETQVSVIKHTNPTGWACSDDPMEAVAKAWEGDPKSAYGGVMGVNQEVTQEIAEAASEYFLTGIVAPSFSESALDLLSRKDKITVTRWTGDWDREWNESLVPVDRGVYLRKEIPENRGDQTAFEVVSERTPTTDERRALEQMWTICGRVSSNGIVLGTRDELLGAGVGQQSRVDAVELAVKKCREYHSTSVEPLVMASDGFFPFPDNVERAGEAGISAIISPGGSIRDEEVIEEADRRDIAMVFTGQRIFRH